MSHPEATLATPPTEDIRPPRPRAVWVVLGLAVIWLIVGFAGSGYQSKLADVQKNDNAAWLPKSAQSTKVADQADNFNSVQTIPGFVVYERSSGLTAADRTKITADAATFRTVNGVAADQVGRPVFKRTVASVSVPLIAKQNGTDVKGPDLVDHEKAVLKAARDGAPRGLAIHSAGGGGLLVAFIDAFSGIDGTLLFTALAVVVVILLIVYRSPLLWIFPLVSAGVVGLGSAVLIIYQLAKHDVLTLNGQSQGILFVLVLGAGTDYALLLISRYREELHTYERRLDAMIRAWRGAAPPIGASALTVVLGLLCLTFGELRSDASLGPVCAIGVACTAVAMLTFLPAFLVIFGRWVFWPRVPHVDHKADIATHGLWGRFAMALGRHPRRSWIATAVVLGVAVIAISGLRTGGLTNTEAFTNTPDALTGQKIFDKNFNAGQGAPAQITASVDKQDAVIGAVEKVPGVASGPGAVCVATDWSKVQATGRPTIDANGCVGPPVAPHDGRILIDAQITDRYDTPAATDTIKRIRSTVAGIDGAQALVGGSTAVNYDIQQASRHDRNLIIPIVLAVILVVLGLLLRAIVAPLLLIATVVLSFSATLGVCALVFNHVFHFADSDPGFPLFAFIFLVALGIDYNIFLMTRVREEALQHGTRAGIVRGLAVTGGVITSAGAVLAATFTVLGVLPLVGLAEIGFAVAFGVLLDTIVVRSILVPALSHEIGKKVWWPSRLAAARAAD
jgi:RND superfamily putative drug exporter